MANMYGPSKKKKGECGATIQFGDDYGDNMSTFRCRLPKRHKGKHREAGDMAYRPGWTKPYALEWEDEHKKGKQNG